MESYKYHTPLLVGAVPRDSEICEDVRIVENYSSALAVGRLFRAMGYRYRIITFRSLRALYGMHGIPLSESMFPTATKSTLSLPTGIFKGRVIH